jgi:hypothetical protein
METLLVYVRDKEKAQLLSELLAALDFVDSVKTGSAAEAAVENPVPAETTADSLEKFIGMWADFSPIEEQAIQTILEERVNYFTGREFEN